MAQRSRSVRTEIVAGFATLVFAFGAVAGYSLWRQARAVESMRLANEGYLQLTLLLGEVRVNQGALNTLLDRLPDERDRIASRTWIASARRTRRGVLILGRNLARRSAPLARQSEDRRLLARVRVELDRIGRTWDEDEPLFDGLFRALAAADAPEARLLQQRLLSREQHTEDVLGRLTRLFEGRVEELSMGVQAEQRRSLHLMVMATVVACVLGLVTALNARRALKPLSLLRDRARAVARGDLSPASVPARPDEIGELAGEFERMVSAVGARDAALRAANEEIRKAEAHLEQLVASLRAAVLVVRADGSVATANPAAGALHEGPLEGRAFADTLFGADERIARAVREVAGAGGTQAFEAVALGERFFDVAVVRFAESGQPSGTLLVADEVTGRERARARYLQGERLAAIGRMAAHVTHEVRNPLSSMELNAEMLADEVAGFGPAGSESLRLVRAIQKEIDRLTGITEEYLRVARLPRPQLEREDVGEVVAEALRFVEAEMRAAGIAVAFAVAPERPMALLDEAQVRQALLNLFRNAREAMEGGRSERPRLTVGVHAADAGVEVSVSDAGPGLAPEARAHLFELFYTTKTRGSGLGLPLTREIVLAHGGTIRVEQADPEAGGGARFVIWLPGARARDQEDQHAA